MTESKVLSDPKKIYERMLADIDSAKKYIYLETYIFDKDEIGNTFKKALEKKAEEGVSVKLLIDAWGSTADKKYLASCIEAGVEVRFFREFRYVIRIISKNHERNHRKLLLIDDRVSYIGSINITKSCLEWRELVLRMKGDITYALSNSFLRSWHHMRHLSRQRIRSVIHEGFEIVQDLPSARFRSTEKKYIEMIRNAKKSIRIETPYFVPSKSIREALARAVKRGIHVTLIIPFRSDVRITDIVRNRYVPFLYKKGIKIRYYVPKTLHSKLLIIDDSLFILGSSNIDYRSFLYQYEINILGTDKEVIAQLNEYWKNSLKDTIPLNYQEWQNRSLVDRILERIISRIRKYL